MIFDIECYPALDFVLNPAIILLSMQPAVDKGSLFEEKNTSAFAKLSILNFCDKI